MTYSPLPRRALRRVPLNGPPRLGRLPAFHQMFIRRTLTPRSNLLLSPSLRFLSTNTKPFFNKPKETTSTTMPSYIVTCNDDATPEQIEAAKQHAKDQGGTIGHEYTLIKGFSVSFPDDSVQCLASHEHVKEVEVDQEVSTQ